ncbi:hypothetical protein [Kibdelosporangium philippinense]|uniref:hypothetical protein n=1 Tax=Kibdelosporangium philippinense TaxID=211113 RepID=UPI003617EEC6
MPKLSAGPESPSDRPRASPRPTGVSHPRNLRLPLASREVACPRWRGGKSLPRHATLLT